MVCVAFTLRLRKLWHLANSESVIKLPPILLTTGTTYD
jgi:hypothetical protein